MGGVLITIGREGYREFDDEKLIKKLVSEGKRIGLPVSTKSFVLKRQKYSEKELNAIRAQKGETYYMTSRGKTITIAFAVKVQADWPLLESSTELTLRDQKTVDLATVTW